MFDNVLLAKYQTYFEAHLLKVTTFKHDPRMTGSFTGRAKAR